jgi:hypothetical protein
MVPGERPGQGGKHLPSYQVGNIPAPRFICMKEKFNALLALMRSAISEDDGSISSTRILMFFFSFLTAAIIWRIVAHVLRLTDIALVGVWLANLPLLIAALMGLIALPYTVNKGTATLSDIAGLFRRDQPKQ